MAALRSSSHQRIELEFVVAFPDTGAARLPPRLLPVGSVLFEVESHFRRAKGHRELLKLTVGIQR